MAIRTTNNAQELIEAFHRPWETGDIASLDGVLAAKWDNHPNNPNGATGPDNWKQTVETLRSIFSDLRYEILEMFEAGDRVIVRGLGRGVHTGNFGPLNATGKAVTFRTLDVHRIEGNRITESWHSEDVYGMLAQIGAIPNVYGAKLEPYSEWN